MAKIQQVFKYVFNLSLVSKALKQVLNRHGLLCQDLFESKPTWSLIYLAEKYNKKTCRINNKSTRC